MEDVTISHRKSGFHTSLSTLSFKSTVHLIKYATSSNFGIHTNVMY